MSDPITKIVRYEVKVFSCSRCGAETQSIYRHNGQWCCFPCLKELGNKLGIRVSSFGALDGFVEDHRLSRLIRIGPPRQDRRRRVALSTRGFNQ